MSVLYGLSPRLGDLQLAAAVPCETVLFDFQICWRDPGAAGMLTYIGESPPIPEATMTSMFL